MADTSDDPFWSTLGAKPAGTPTATGTATTPAPATSASDDPFWSTLGSTSATTTSTGTTTTSGQEQPDKPWWQSAANYAGGVVGSFTHGLSFGLDNPLDRATAYLFPGSGFAKLQPQREQQQQQFQKDNPLVANTAEIAGSIPTYMMSEGALRAAVPVVQGGAAIPRVVGNLVTSGARNALVSGAQAGGMADGSPTDRLEAAKQGAITGAIVGPVADLAGQAVGKVLGAAGNVSAADANLGQLARTKYNIPVTAADLSGNQLYRTATDQMSKLSFSGTAPADAAKRAAWQGAIAKEMGEDATTFTPEVMDRAKTRIGQTFDQVANNTSIDTASTDTLTNVDLPRIEADMHQVLPSNEIAPIKAQLDNIVDVASRQNGTISGDSYQALTRKGAPLDRAESSNDPNVRFVAGQIRDALDDAFVRSASPVDQAALVQAKYQYRVMRTVQDLAAGSRDGSITPAGFMQKVLTASRRFDSPTGGVAYTGGGNIGELARIGQLMRAAPQTGTADRWLVNSLLLGGVGGSAYLNPAYIAGVPAALAANRVAGSYLRSGAAANRVIEGALSPGMYRPSQVVAPTVIGAQNALRRNPLPQ